MGLSGFVHGETGRELSGAWFTGSELGCVSSESLVIHSPHSREETSLQRIYEEIHCDINGCGDGERS